MDHKQGWASGAMRRNAFAFLTRQERRKYEIARELGLLDRTQRQGNGPHRRSDGPGKPRSAAGSAGAIRSAEAVGSAGAIRSAEAVDSAGTAGLTGDKRRRMNACTPHLHPYTTG